MVANRLKELAGEKCQVTVVDRESNFSFGASWLHLMTGEKRLNEIVAGRERLKEKEIKFLKAEVSAIDCEKSKVQTSEGDLTYEYLIVALGAKLAPERIKGLPEAEYYHMYLPQEALRLQKALASFSGGKIALVIGSTPFKCPAAPYEAAMLIEWFLKKKELRGKSEIEVYTPEPFPLPVAGPEVGDKVIEILKEKQINYNSQMQVEEVKGDSKQVLFSNGQKADYDLLVLIPPHLCPEVVSRSGLTDESGWIPVNGKTLETRFQNVFALGDVASIKLPVGKPLPKAASFALGQAEVVAFNLAAQLLGVSTKVWEGNGECYLEMGGNQAAYGVGNFYARPGPVVNFQKPSEAYSRLKELWIQYWRSRLL